MRKLVSADHCNSSWISRNAVSDRSLLTAMYLRIVKRNQHQLLASLIQNTLLRVIVYTCEQSPWTLQPSVKKYRVSDYQQPLKKCLLPKPWCHVQECREHHKPPKWSCLTSCPNRQILWRSMYHAHGKPRACPEWEVPSSLYTQKVKNHWITPDCTAATASVVV
jgi:hypothetical protein